MLHIEVRTPLAASELLKEIVRSELREQSI